MNSAIYFIILALLIPGFIFSHFYLKGINEYSYTEKYNPVSLHTFIAVVIAIATLLLFVCFFYTGLTADQINISSVTRPILIESLIVYLVSIMVWGVLGICMEKYHIGYKFLIPRTYWNKLFSDSDSKFGGKRDTYITAVVDVSGKPILYTGILSGYKTYHDELEYIILAAPRRRNLENDKLDGEDDFNQRFYSIDVQDLVIKYNDILNLGILFFEIDDN